MKRLNIYHFTTLLIVFFFIGHTFGGMVFHKPLSADEQSVRESMKVVRFVFNGSECTYFGFYMGFGLMFSIFQLLTGFLSFQFSRHSGLEKYPSLLWSLCLSYLGVSVLSAKYFFMVPTLTSACLTLIFAYKAVQLRPLAREK